MPEILTVAKLEQIPNGKAISVQAANRRVAVFNIDGKLHAIEDTCTHAGAPLSEGRLQGTTVTCPWHGATFDVTTGAVLGSPAFENVASYKVSVEGENVLIEMP